MSAPVFKRQYTWKTLAADPDRAAEIARVLGVSSIAALILAQRTGNIVDRLGAPFGNHLDAVNKFIRPSLMDLHPPKTMKEMSRAAERIVRAIREKQRITIFGDYDADGITATVIMLTVLRALGARVDYYLPSRLEEGYGISTTFVEKAINEKINLVVTVDCGTSEIEKVARLMQSGVDVVITDHHEPGDKPLPAAYAVLNPKRSDATYPFRDLVGAGVAFKLAWGVCEVMAGSNKVGAELQEVLLNVLPLAAIGTIADVAPMLDENRVIVKHGLARLPFTTAGLRALLKIAKVAPEAATCHGIAWMVAPRINAAGRLDAADLALHVLLETDEQVAHNLVRELDGKNEERKRLCNETLKIAHSLLEGEDHAKNGAIVLAEAQLHEGVIGIVAGRLAEDYNLPCAVISLNADGSGRGSARGVTGFNLHAAMVSAEKMLGNYGGHEQAVGFSIARENLAAFREHFINYCRTQTVAAMPTLPIDCEVTLSEIHDGLMRELLLLMPFGEGNHQPRFLCRKVKITGTPRLLGEGSKRFFRLSAVQNNIGYHALSRNLTLLDAIDRHKRRLWNMVFTVSRNMYFDPPRLELQIVDMELCD